MPFEVTPSGAGEFACEIEIYLDVGYLATHPIKVHGTAIKPAQ